MKYILDIDSLKTCISLLPNDGVSVNINAVISLINSFPKDEVTNTNSNTNFIHGYLKPHKPINFVIKSPEQKKQEIKDVIGLNGRIAHNIQKELNKMKRAKIISAFPACGKSTYYKEWSQYSEENVWRRNNDGKQVYNNIGDPCGEKILDSDSSLFSWIYDENGNKTDKRNPDFPNNYIKHIKEHMETEDIIFVSSHKVVRDALKAENIPYILIYPRKDMKEEWMDRFRKRGNDESFIKFQDEHWDEFIDDMENETYPTKIVLEDYLNYNAITVTLMNGVMDYSEEA